MSCDVFFSVLAPPGGLPRTAADKAVALLDEALQRCPGSSSSLAAGNHQPTTSTSGTASWSQPQPQFVAIHIEDMTPKTAHSNRQSAPCNKVCWRVTAKASDKSGPVCPAAPMRPRPRTVLLPANEVHCLWNNL